MAINTNRLIVKGDHTYLELNTTITLNILIKVSYVETNIVMKELNSKTKFIKEHYVPRNNLRYLSVYVYFSSTFE